MFLGLSGGGWAKVRVCSFMADCRICVLIHYSCVICRGKHPAVHSTGVKRMFYKPKMRWNPLLTMLDITNMKQRLLQPEWHKFTRRNRLFLGFAVSDDLCIICVYD